MRITIPHRNEAIVKLSEKGLSIKDISAMFHLTERRIRQVIHTLKNLP